MIPALSVPTTRAACATLDAADPLAQWRSRFSIPDDVVYLDGNSLGALPRDVPERLRHAIEEEWGTGLIRSWNTAGWMAAPTRVGDKLAALLGASPGEVVVTDSTSVNLFKLLAGALGARPGRRVIVTQRDNFPTDVYVAEGLARLAGASLRVVEADAIESALDSSVAVLSLTHVHYATGAMHDLPALTAAAHEAGALALWDLSHTAGAMPVDLAAGGIDLAVGCGYKYLNGGPGAPAWLYVPQRLQAAVQQPLTGWLGHAEPFAFEPSYRPAPGVLQGMVGTPPILSLTALEVAIDLWLAVGDLAPVRAKSVALAELFIRLVDERCAGAGLELATPREAARRGSIVSLRHDGGYAVMQALIARGVIGDFRAPDILRFGLTPLYTRHTDVWDAVEALRDVLETGEWRRPEHSVRADVT
jgi:kynureninase